MKHINHKQTGKDMSLATQLENIYGVTIKRKVTEWRNVWSKIVKRKQGILYLSHCLKMKKIPNEFHKNYVCRSTLTRRLKFELEYELTKEGIESKKDEILGLASDEKTVKSELCNKLTTSDFEVISKIIDNGIDEEVRKTITAHSKKLKELGIPRVNQRTPEISDTREVEIRPRNLKLRVYNTPIDGYLPGCSYELNKPNKENSEHNNKKTHTETKRNKIDMKIVKTSGDFEENKSKKVVNISKKVIPERIINILKLGLNFAFTNERIDKNALMVELINGSKNLDTNQQMEFCLETTNLIMNHKESRKVDPRIKELSDFCEKENVLIKKSDKGGATVIMDKEEYERKLNNLVSEDSVYTEIPYDITNKLIATLIKVTKELVNEGELTPTIRKSVIPGTAKAPSFTGLPKVHKTNVPLRPIINNIGSPLYGLAKFIVTTLKKIEKLLNFTVQNSYEFIEKLNNLTPLEDEIMVSYDVVSMYTNVDTESALKTLENWLRRHTDILNGTNLSSEGIIKLMSLCVSNTYFTHNGKFYKQKQGLPMGSPISPLLANIWLDEIEKCFLSTLSNPPRLWIRYLDDIFTLVKNLEENLKSYLRRLNNVNDKIKFTEERENNKVLNFLDVQVTREEDRFDKKVFRKPAYAGNILHFNSNHPFGIKMGVLKSQIIRGLRITDKKNWNEEIHTIKRIFQENGYPLWRIEKQIKIVINNFQKNGKYIPTTKVLKDKKGFMCLPDSSLTKKIKEKAKQFGIMTVTKQKKTINTTVSKFDRIGSFNNNLNRGGVYEIPCKGCNKKYIGQTKRPIMKRMKEHKTATIKNDRSSEVANHVRQTGHHINWEGIRRVSGFENEYSKRMIRESIEINSRKDTMNVKSDETLIHPIYKEFIKTKLYNKSTD